MKKRCQEKNTLVELISLALQERGWNIAKLSKESGVSQPVISRLLKGTVNVKIENIYRILRALNLLNVQRKKEFFPPQLTIQTTEKLKTFFKDFALDNYIPVKLLKKMEPLQQVLL